VNGQRKPPFRVLPAGHGVGWMMQSLALLKAQAARLLFLAVLMQFLLGLTQLPLIGLFIIIAVPALTAGLLEAFHVTARGGVPAVSLLFAPLTSGAHVGRLLGTGGLIFLVGLLTISIALSGSEMVMDEELLSRIEAGDMEALSTLDPEMLERLLLAFLLGVAVSGTLGYFTIPLIWFGGASLGTALLTGLRALFANWKPFLVLALMMIVVLFPIALIGGVLFELASVAGGLSFIVVGAVMILLLAFQMVIFGTQYCAFRDVFGIGREEGDSHQRDDSQLLA
jgi:hypothetical protein